MAEYLVKRPWGDHAKGDKVSLNPRQAQFLEASGQVEPKKPVKAPAKAAKGGKA